MDQLNLTLVWRQCCGGRIDDDATAADTMLDQPGAYGDPTHETDAAIAATDHRLGENHHAFGRHRMGKQLVESALAGRVEAGTSGVKGDLEGRRCRWRRRSGGWVGVARSEEHTSELQS